MSTQDSSGPFHHYTVLDDKEFQVRGRTLFFVVILFTVILLVTVFLLYARWVCRHPPTSPSSSVHAPPQKSRGLGAALIRALPIILYHHHQSSGDSEKEAGCGECSICLGVFEEGEKVKVLPLCRHRYHSDCVDKWLSAHSNCPLCRTSLLPISDDVLQIVLQ